MSGRNPGRAGVGINMDFYKKRRQQFLTEVAYDGARLFFENEAAPEFLEAFLTPGFDADDHKRNANAYADGCFANFMLRYTGGEPIPILRDDLDHVVAAYQQAAKYIKIYEGNSKFPPLRFMEMDEYERVLQMIGLSFLLHRRDLLPKIAGMFDPIFEEQDFLYEDILSYEFEGRFEVDKWYHEEYRDLVNSLCRDTEAEVIADLHSYLKNWYKSFEMAPWHNSHLEIEDDMCGGYFGYWAIEAATVAYLLDVDDSSFRENLVYPKDLVDYAKEMDELEIRTLDKDVGLRRRVAGGNPCPESGYWMTPAWPSSRQYFNAGDLMPIFVNSPYGNTIWQWSSEQR